ncbi:MAG: cation:proton antiporter [Bdellovibrionales bacterium]|nr:cation:proton antiporter [Bdellovibrionales bacterium]
MFFELLPLTTAFVLVLLASLQVGEGIKRVHLPMISGFILTGVLAGPDLLGFVSDSDTQYFFIIDAVALPFIAYLAGAELHFSEIANKIKTILIILSGIIVVVLIFGVTALLLFSEAIPFMEGMPLHHKVAVALLGATVLVAKSPSSLVALIKELRARGPYIQVVLGVTVLMDSVVIILFSFQSLIAQMLFYDGGVNLYHLFGPILEIGIDVIAGLLVALAVNGILSLPLPHVLSSVLILLSGYVVSSLGGWIPPFSLLGMHIQLLSEPLLICVVAGAWLSNFSKYRAEFEKLLADASPLIFLVFFTSLGITINLDVLSKTWHIALLLMLVRGVAMVFGAFLGGTLAGNDPSHNRYLGTAFITQAGISLSLAKTVAVMYPSWGEEFATLFIAVIVMNTLIGPTFTKWGILRVGESRVKSLPQERRSGRRAMIFGIEDQSRALYQQLHVQDWEVSLVDTDPERVEALQDGVEQPLCLMEVSEEELKGLGAHLVDAIILLMDDETNYQIAEIAYEQFGDVDIVARLSKPSDSARFHEIGVMVVEPVSAMIALLDHCVRSPVAAALLLGKEQKKDIVELQVTNPNIHGVSLRDLHFEGDSLVLAIRRKGQVLFSHGYTRLRLGDEVTVAGSVDSLAHVRMLLSS